MTPHLGYVALDRATLQAAEQAREADLASSIVRRASVEPASARVRRLRGLAQQMLAAIGDGR